MNMKTCPKGHFYDGDTNATCPTCAAENNRGMMGDYGATEPIGGAFSGFDDIGATEPVGNDFTGTKAPTHGFEKGGNTMFFEDRVPGADNYNDETMAVNPGKVAGFTPVVGWLVCIEGPDRGNDYRIRTGYNHIGRAEHMDICIRGDKQISREKHALIAYDDTEKIFFFGPSDGRNIVRVNNKMVMMPTELNPYDIITIGTSKLIFVSLCGEHFDWNN